ncbi:CGNR zinc finger domain-containing protein [Mesorhizobium sp. ES1-1]|uniref:CGNR zinc finger domain-containing protein n=1 Tax=Mesorhizobium sp. ES1-1 TaxID=2876629 RepID=UPI001CCBAF98|nr:CGNR zinc finger domain-containing protein [Mesorhizobium sp. ES1-1]MBZ9678537.1 CGNR zinc finger domain-containing protein [Mesorhizobium sp. ES1-1]
MSDEKTVTTMRLVGGSPVLDFVNTVDARRDRWGPDLLRTYDDLIEWAIRVGLITSEVGAGLAKASAAAELDAALAEAKALRESIYAVFQAEAAGEPAPAPQGADLTRAASRALSNRRLCHAGAQFFWGWKDDGDLNTIADRVALEAAELLVTSKLRRPVRECLGPYCGWLFLDSSRGGHRRWCSDASCGTHMRVRRFRASRAHGERS